MAKEKRLYKQPYTTLFSVDWIYLKFGFSCRLSTLLPLPSFRLQVALIIFRRTIFSNQQEDYTLPLGSNRLNIAKRKIVHKGTDGVTLIAEPNDVFSIETKIDYSSKTLKVQEAKLSNISDFNHEIASSRTFCFLHEFCSISS